MTGLGRAPLITPGKFGCDPPVLVDSGNRIVQAFGATGGEKRINDTKRILLLMKVIGIASSPRKGGNSQTLVEQILSGAREAGAATELVRLCDLDIQPCKGCNTCKTGLPCVIEDDMGELYEKLAKADAVVFGSPVYWFRLNAQAYPFIDRFYAYLKPDFSCDFPKGKKFATAFTCGSVGPEILNPLNDYLKNVFGFLGFVDAGFISQGQCYQLSDLANYPEKIKEAKELGHSLVQ